VPNVRVTYSPNKNQVGKIIELADDDARAMIAEGRAVAVSDEEAAAEQAPKTADAGGGEQPTNDAEDGEAAKPRRASSK